MREIRVYIKWNKAVKLRKSESGKLSYDVSLGAFDGEYDKLSKEEFLSKATSILNTLKEKMCLLLSLNCRL